jgi:hypothetical protein
VKIDDILGYLFITPLIILLWVVVIVVALEAWDHYAPIFRRDEE